jgi:hypothetical protein
VNISQPKLRSEKFDNNNNAIVILHKTIEEPAAIDAAIPSSDNLHGTITEKLRIWNLHAVSEVL